MERVSKRPVRGRVRKRERGPDSYTKAVRQFPRVYPIRKPGVTRQFRNYGNGTYYTMTIRRETNKVRKLGFKTLSLEIGVTGQPGNRRRRRPLTLFPHQGVFPSRKTIPFSLRGRAGEGEALIRPRPVSSLESSSPASTGMKRQELVEGGRI